MMRGIEGQAMMNKKERKEFGKAVLRMLSSGKVCYTCPSDFYGGDFFPCSWCFGFLEKEREREKRDGIYLCPCIELGSEEAVKATWLKLEELGFLD